MGAAFNGAWEVLAFRAGAALFAVKAEAATAARHTSVAPLPMEAEAAAAASYASAALLAVRTLLLNAPLDWMRRRGVRRCRNCWGCAIHGSEL